MACEFGWQRPELRSEKKNMSLCLYRKENQTGKSYMNVYGIVKKYYSHVSKRNTPRMDAVATKLYSVMTWGASLNWNVMGTFK